MIRTKGFQIKKRTANFIFDGEDKELNNLNKYQAVALGLYDGA